MTTTPDVRPRLRPHCPSCAALCCVALPFARSADVAADEPAGLPCAHLGGVGGGPPRRGRGGRVRPVRGGPPARHRDVVGQDLRGRDIARADLRGLDLTHTDLLGADLRGADVRGTDLHDVLFLLPAQVAAAPGDAATRLPAVVERPAAGVLTRYRAGRTPEAVSR